MDESETTDLPGNDASWYRALLVDQDAGTMVETVPEQQSLLVETQPDEEDAPSDPEPPQPAEQPDPDPAEAAVEDDQPTEPEMPDADPEEALDDVTDPEPDDTPEDVPDLVVAPPVLTGDAEPVHFPDEESPEQEPSPAAATEDDDKASPQISSVPPEDDRLDNTSEMVGQLWTSSEPDDSFEAWEPDAMDSTISSTRKFRWSSVVAALAVVALIVVGLVLLPSMTRNRADAHREMMLTALQDLRGELPDTQASLQIATEPGTDDLALSDLSTQLTVLTAKASAVDDAARADLPTAPPLTSTEPIDELAPIQQRLEPLATTAQTIQRRIGNLAEYRRLMSGFLALPDLPTTADTATQADLRVVLASAQAESASILAELPSDVSLSEHQTLARSITDMFASWQIDYLEALRTQDPLLAQTLVDQLAAQLADLDTELVTPLAQIRRQTDTDLIDLARSIDEVVALAKGTEPTPQ